jgi:hypothetical protein
VEAFFDNSSALFLARIGSVSMSSEVALLRAHGGATLKPRLPVRASTRIPYRGAVAHISNVASRLASHVSMFGSIK